MRVYLHRLFHPLVNRKAQLLLPAVLLLPIFVLLIYLLVETTKLSIAKVRHQFALDNAAYSQMSSVSVFLNVVGLLNGPLPYRVMRTYDKPLVLVDEGTLYREKKNWTVFDLFYQAGAIASIGPDYDQKARHNPNPAPDSTDWGVQFAKYDGIDKVDENGDGTPDYDRSGWEKEKPDEIKDTVVVMNKEMVQKHYVTSKEVLPIIRDYLSTYIQVGDIFNLHKHLYQDNIKNAQAFRQGYFLNVDDCKERSCARQSASRLERYLNIPVKRQEAETLMFYITAASGISGGSGGAYDFEFPMKDVEADPLYMFAYVEPAGLNTLRNLKRGIVLKQSFPLPRNNLT